MEKTKKALSALKSQVLSFQGFTLIELLVVMSVIAILAAGVFSLLNPLAQFQKARDARRKSDLSQVQKALEQYYQDNGGKYPPSTGYTTGGSHNYEIQLGPTNNPTPVDWGSSTFAPYIQVMPKDPTSPTNNYAYYSDSTGQSYWLYANLERGGNDSNTCSGTGFPTPTPCPNASPVNINIVCGGNPPVCNYGVSSPNTSP